MCYYEKRSNESPKSNLFLLCIHSAECSKCGDIKKITIFSEHKDGIALVKFSTAYAAQQCINLTNGRYFGGINLKSFFWDGVTNYGIGKYMTEK